MERTGKFRVAIFASGSGTNAEAIMKYFEGDLQIEVVLLLSNNLEAGALIRARNFNVPVKVFGKIQFRESDEVLKWLKEAGVTHIVLAGFLWLVPQNILHAFPDKIINIHPALLPMFGGKGMYGSKVHDAVVASRAKESGVTIHAVNERFDEGKILFQASCRVDPADTSQIIAEKIHVLEHAHYPREIKKWILNGDNSMT